uniref:interleukin-10 receptor subunit beta n=1 Tax=Semicossyphus pulcher TaxID=241346 RepID=UPI0037E7C9C6
MSASMCVCLLLWSIRTCAVAAELASPQNVSMLTLNTNYTLTWDWDQSSADGLSVSFTTQYLQNWKYEQKPRREDPWNPACEDSPHRSCDLTAFDLYYLGIWVLRVRATVNGSHSDWVQRKFCPDRHAAVGPPSKVDLSPAGSDLDVFISHPVSSTNTSMKEHLKDLYYRILYWEHSGDTERVKSLDSSVTVVTLPSLKSWTRYCVSVQTRYDFYNKSSSFTAPLCMQTQGALPWWQIFLFFLASLVVFFLLVLFSLCVFFWCCRTLKATLYPSVQLPAHFKYLCDSPSSDGPRLLTPDSESELLCEKVTVCPKPLVLELQPPPSEALQGPPADIRHSRQDSGGSGDSGVYSTGGSSSLRQPPHPLSRGGGGVSCQDPLDLDQVKMRDMTLGSRSQLITDEGVVDVSV